MEHGRKPHQRGTPVEHEKGRMKETDSAKNRVGLDVPAQPGLASRILTLEMKTYFPLLSEAYPPVSRARPLVMRITRSLENGRAKRPGLGEGAALSRLLSAYTEGMISGASATGIAHGSY